MSAAASTEGATPTHPMPSRAPSLRSADSTDVSPSAADCPRHAPGSLYTRNTDGAYASHVPACIGGDCILGRCDRIRDARRTTDSPTTVLSWQQRRLREVLEAFPADTAVPQDALRVRARLDAVVALHEAYLTWLRSGEDTPHTREPLELALRAAEATHDTYTPSTAVYDRICTRLGRPRVLGGAGTPASSVSGGSDSDTDTEEEMTG